MQWPPEALFRTDYSGVGASGKPGAVHANHHRCQNRAVHDGDGDLELGRLEQKYDQSLILFFGATPGPASKS